MKNKTIVLISFITLLYSCASLPSYDSVFFKDELKPAKINIPNEYQGEEILIVDRANGINTNEIVFDRNEEIFVTNLFNMFKKEIKARDYFKLSPSIRETKTVISGTFPPPLDKEIAKQLVKGEKFIVSLEFFEITKSINYRNDWENIYDVNKILIKSQQIVIARNDLTAICGWRLYDTSGNVIDEIISRKNYDYQMKGYDMADAKYKTLEGEKLAYKNMGKYLGFEYADRISPYNMSLSRNYYIRSRTSKDFEIAMKYINEGNWELASQVWNELTQYSNNEKDIARAHFNLGVYYEKNNNLKLAIQHLREATIANEKIGENYLEALLQKETTQK